MRSFASGLGTSWGERKKGTDEVQVVVVRISAAWRQRLVPFLAPEEMFKFSLQIVARKMNDEGWTQVTDLGGAGEEKRGEEGM